MKRAIGVVLGTCLALFVASSQTVGCSDDEASEAICNDNQDNDNDGKTDCGDSDCAADPVCRGADQGVFDLGSIDASAGDGPPADGGQADAPGGPALQSSVINTIVLPENGTQFAVDLDGTGPKNQLGAIIGALKLTGLDLQQNINNAVASEQVLILFDLFGQSLDNEPAATLQGHLGFDREPLKDNFAGDNDFGISSNSPRNAILSGSIDSGKIAMGPGTMLIPFPLVPTEPLILTLKVARLSATGGSALTAPESMNDGVLAGAIPSEDLDNKLLPAVATLLTSQLNDPQVSPETKNAILLLDTDGDKISISVSDIKGSIIGDALLPDVDTDGMAGPDALSVGIGFTAVTCSITR